MKTPPRKAKKRPVSAERIQKPNPLLDGLSDRVQDSIKRVDHAVLAAEQSQILERMTSDKRLQTVWSELTRRKRPSRAFFHPAIPRNGHATSDDAQSEALRELFHFVFCAARDKMSVSKPSEVKEGKELLLRNATIMRSVAQDLELASLAGQLGIVSDQARTLAAINCQSLRMVANWLDHLASAHRAPDDALMVKRHRGDPVVRGVQILISEKLKKLFGADLDKIAATLASVALKKPTSVKITRSARKRPKPSNKGRIQRSQG
jgi:hypothetical protein